MREPWSSAARSLAPDPSTRRPRGVASHFVIFYPRRFRLRVVIATSERESVLRANIASIGERWSDRLRRLLRAV